MYRERAGPEADIAVAIGPGAITAGYTVLFVSAPTLVAQLAKAYADSRLEERLLHAAAPSPA